MLETIARITRMLHRMHHNEQGFTLIELIIVIAIIAVISAIAIPQVTGRIHEARVAADKANVRILQAAVDLYYIEHGHYDDISDGKISGMDKIDTSDNSPLVKEGFLHEGPEHPFEGENYLLIEGTVKSTATWDN